jgi:hypothetical protein
MAPPPDQLSPRPSAPGALATLAVDRRSDQAGWGYVGVLHRQQARRARPAAPTTCLGEIVIEAEDTARVSRRRDACHPRRRQRLLVVPWLHPPQALVQCRISRGSH